jgi:hypothetical protein
MEIRTIAGFKGEYKKAKTYGDMDRVIRRCSTELLIQLAKALDIVHTGFDLTMRDESWMRAMDFELERRTRDDA